jgi:hypothetical protein
MWFFGSGSPYSGKQSAEYSHERMFTVSYFIPNSIGWKKYEFNISLDAVPLILAIFDWMDLHYLSSGIYRECVVI